MDRLRNRYEPLEVIGRGGQGEVLRGLDHQHNRSVALKVRCVTDQAAREALLSEARILLSLDPHKGLPLVRDDFFEGDCYYLIMDWIEGKNLERIVEEQGDPGLAVSTALDYISQAAEALDHLHSHDPPIVHGDVKPANLILTERGRAVLVDFGIAASSREKAAAIRTPWFSAPELAAGDPPTPASDIYGLAATAFALLVGSPPQGIKPSWEGIPVWAAEAVQRVIFRGLATDPARRPVSAGEFVERLRSRLEYSLPSGTVTFLLTDLEGSTRLWERDPKSMEEAMARHDEIVPDALDANGGRLVKSQGEGDSAFAVFERPRQAASAALELQRAFITETWPTGTPLRIRIALLTGEAHVRGGDYYGTAVARCARLRSIGHGGQILLSQATADLLKDSFPNGVELRALGSHRLKDLSRPEQVYQLCHRDLPSEFPPLRSLDAFPNNLPVQLTSFIGRAHEIEELKELTTTKRLLTVIGAGGAGKTRLALQVAAELLEAYPDGVWLVELAAITDVDLVPQAVASVLRVREEAGRTIIDSIIDYLRPRRTLLILDNCEHLVQTCAGFVEVLLKTCSDLRVVATSREALGIPGEAVWRIPALEHPDPGKVPIDVVAGYESVRLFVDRATSHDLAFSLMEENAADVAEICRRLDGLPLAIELAAARTKVMKPNDIVARLDERFRLIAGGARTAPARHQTLRALIDWSYDLLTEKERVVFRRLSVFAGGFTIEAAERIASGGGLDELDAVDLLSSLADKSLVVAGDRYGEKRYQLLDTLREYAAEKLADSDEQASVKARHLEWLVSLAERAYAGWGSPEEAKYLDQLAEERDNLRAALDWSLSDGPPEIGLHLAASASRLWQVAGPFTEGRRWLEAALARCPSGSAEIRARALRAAAILSTYNGDYIAARRLGEQGLVLLRELGDTTGIAWSLQNLGLVSVRQGDHSRARAFYEETLALGRELGDGDVVLQALGSLGSLALDEADLHSARLILEESLAIARRSGRRLLFATFLNQLGRVAQLEGDYASARRLHEEAMSVALDVEDQWMVSMAMLSLARVEMVEGHFKEASAALERGLSIAQQREARPDVAAIQFEMGVLAETQGDFDLALSIFDENLSLRRELDSGRGVAACLEHLGNLAWRTGDFEGAHSMLQESLSIRRDLGHRLGIASSLQGLGDLARAKGEWERAAARYREAVRIRSDVRHRLGLVQCLERLAICAARRGDKERPAKLFGAAAAFRDVISAVLPPAERESVETEIASVRFALGLEAFEGAWQEGREMPLEEAIEVASRT